MSNEQTMVASSGAGEIHLRAVVHRTAEGRTPRMTLQMSGVGLGVAGGVWWTTA